MRYFWLAVVWVVWCAVHSALLSDSFKRKLTGSLAWIDCHWRFFYCLTATATLSVPLWMAYRAGGPWIIVWPNPWWPGIITLAALAVCWSAIRAFGGAAAFLGLDSLIGRCEPPRPDHPKREGILGWVRHPLYSMALILLWAHDLNAAGLVTSTILSLYVLLGTYLEEKRLEAEWGPSWRQYRRQVSALVPVKKLAALIKKNRAG